MRQKPERLFLWGDGMANTALVVGGGIGGLAVAAALAQRGVDVTLTEQAAAITEVGAGIQVSPNGLAVLRALGLEAGLIAAGAVQAQAVVLEDYRQGTQVARLDLTQLRDQRYLFVHRADIVALLEQAARAAGVTMRMGRRAVRVVPGAIPEVHFAQGSALHADLVVCADGVRSVGRAAVDGPGQAQFTGQVAWRALVRADAAEPRATVTMGPGRHIVRYPLRQSRWMNIVAVQERAEWAEEGWQHRDDPENLRAAFADFDGPVRRVLAQVEEVHLWGLFRHPVAETWVREGVALLGDAAHPTLPFLAQGANMALEDAWVLAQTIAERGALTRYQQMRRSRVARVINTASGNAKKYHLRPGPLRWAAHLGLWVGSAVAPGPMMRQFDWLYAYDVTKPQP